MLPKQVKQLQYAEKRMRNLWHAMVIAGEGGASPLQLERMYDAYLLVLEEYLRCYQSFWPDQLACPGDHTHRCA
jgi:hypothetical protein